jgi:hypothetical protein
MANNKKDIETRGSIFSKVRRLFNKQDIRFVTDQNYQYFLVLPKNVCNR